MDGITVTKTAVLRSEISIGSAHEEGIASGVPETRASEETGS